MTNDNGGQRSGLSFRVIDVVLVDDDADTLELMRTCLRSHQCSVRIARSVREAIDRVRESVPDVVISDLHFADSLSGWDLVEALRSHGPTHGVACIAISGDEPTEVLDAFDAQLQKPVDLAELVELIRRLTDASPRLRSGEGS